MADRNDASSSMITPSGTAGRVNSTADAKGGRGESVVTEFLDAARSAAESLLEEQKRQVAERVSGVAEALRCAIHPLDRSQNRIMARYVEEAADRVEDFSRTVRERHWNELVADTEEFARRQPTLFVIGAVATGFLIGRLLWTSAAGERERATAAPPSSETSRTVTAAVSSGSGTGELTGHAAASSGAMEDR
ncbi:MAG TPA: hypothetical protein VKF83_10895 [Stellaceae bacterium]|nr:hypothetical protein [Stellaceae bacterium]